MSKENIQEHECQAIREIFDRVGDMKKVIIVGIDPAEKEHKAVICNGHGDFFSKPLSVINDGSGLAFLNSHLEGLCLKHGIDRDNVIIGIEYPGPWGENFADHLMHTWETVIDIHPALAKRFRENQTSDNDRLAAQSVCRCLIQKQGRERESDNEYTELLMIVRHHQKLTRLQTATGNRIHAAAGILFPGFLNGDATDITPLGNASLDILGKMPIHRIKHMSCQQLAKWLGQRKVINAGEQAEKLKKLAANVLPPSEEKERANRIIMEDLVAGYRLLSGQIDTALKKMAKLLRQTPHWLLTTINGIGVSTAAQIAAELFARGRDAGAESKVNYSGLTSRTHQTGGDGKPQVSKGKPFSFNRRAKRIILMAAENVAKHDKGELSEYYRYHNEKGKNAKYGLGRKLIRFAVKLNDSPEAWLPEIMRDGKIGETFKDCYYRDLFGKLERKWKAYAQDAPAADKDLLAQWTECISTMYGIETSLGK